MKIVLLCYFSSQAIVYIFFKNQDYYFTFEFLGKIAMNDDRKLTTDEACIVQSCHEQLENGLLVLLMNKYLFFTFNHYLRTILRVGLGQILVKKLHELVQEQLEARLDVENSNSAFKFLF